MSRYGYRHQRIRAALLPEAYGRACLHCGLAMLPGQALNLDHTSDGAQYRGVVHARCNRREGARRGNAARRRRRIGGVFWS
jgi:Recombination endonuclease VII